MQIFKNIMRNIQIVHFLVEPEEGQEVDGKSCGGRERGRERGKEGGRETFKGFAGH
jgi:hypothetical protein